MYLAYFDESGDAGFVRSPTEAFALACILVYEDDWLDFLDQTIYFRRWVRDQFGLRMKEELKATHLVHGDGPWRKLGHGDDVRLRVYKQALRLQHKCGIVKTFAIVIRKAEITHQATNNPREVAWRYALQRLERFCSDEDENVSMYPDAGHGNFIRQKTRQMRRISYVPSAFDAGLLDRRMRCLVEDPSDRRSHDSYIVQLCDLNAYAAHRRVYPSKKLGKKMWKELRDARLARVRKLYTGDPRGMVIWP